jgi:hypothetical protein
MEFLVWTAEWFHSYALCACGGPVYEPAGVANVGDSQQMDRIGQQGQLPDATHVPYKKIGGKRIAPCRHRY